MSSLYSYILKFITTQVRPDTRPDPIGYYTTRPDTRDFNTGNVFAIPTRNAKMPEKPSLTGSSSNRRGISIQVRTAFKLFVPFRISKHESQGQDRDKSFGENVAINYYVFCFFVGLMLVRCRSGSEKLYQEVAFIYAVRSKTFPIKLTRGGLFLPLNNSQRRIQITI